MDAGDLETLRQYFDCLDRTQTGSLSLKDLWPVADALVLKLGNSARRSFLWVACKRFDRNHDGYDSVQIWNDLMNDNSVQKNPFGFIINLNTFSETTSNVLSSKSNAILNGSQGKVTQLKYLLAHQ